MALKWRVITLCPATFNGHECDREEHHDGPHSADVWKTTKSGQIDKRYVHPTHVYRWDTTSYPPIEETDPVHLGSTPLS